MSQANTCVGVSFLIRLQACNFNKKRLQHSCFPVKFAKFLRMPFLQMAASDWLRVFDIFSIFCFKVTSRKKEVLMTLEFHRHLYIDVTHLRDLMMNQCKNVVNMFYRSPVSNVNIFNILVRKVRTLGRIPDSKKIFRKSVKIKIKANILRCTWRVFDIA